MTELGITIDRVGEKYNERLKCGAGADKWKAGFIRRAGLTGLMLRGIENTTRGELESAK
jgi:hypothetical protein